MLTIFLQLALAVVALGFGLTALRVALAAWTATTAQAAAWGLAGAAFTLSGGSSALQATWAALAFFAGPESAVYRTYLAVAPVGNHARALLMIAFGVVFLLFLFRRTPFTAQHWAASGLAMAVGMVAGALLGWLEGGMNYGSHFTVVALLNGVLVWVLLGALFRALFTTRVDRLLWGALVCYSTYQMVGVLWNAAVVLRDVPGVWTPPPRWLNLLGIVFYMAMIGLGLRRLVLARQGRPVSNLVGDLPESKAVNV